MSNKIEKLNVSQPVLLKELGHKIAAAFSDLKQIKPSTDPIDEKDLPAYSSALARFCQTTFQAFESKMWKRAPESFCTKSYTAVFHVWMASILGCSPTTCQQYFRLARIACELDADLWNSVFATHTDLRSLRSLSRMTEARQRSLVAHYLRKVGSVTSRGTSSDVLDLPNPSTLKWTTEGEEWKDSNPEKVRAAKKDDAVKPLLSETRKRKSSPSPVLPTLVGPSVRPRLLQHVSLSLHSDAPIIGTLPSPADLEASIGHPRQFSLPTPQHVSYPAMCGEQAYESQSLYSRPQVMHMLPLQSSVDPEQYYPPAFQAYQPQYTQYLDMYGQQSEQQQQQQQQQYWPEEQQQQPQPPTHIYVYPPQNQYVPYAHIPPVYYPQQSQLQRICENSKPY